MFSGRMRSSSSVRPFLLTALLLTMLLFAYSTLAEPVIQCNMTLRGSCPGTEILYVQNDTGGYDNAHAQNISVGTYNYAVCCNTSEGSLGIGCGSVFARLSSASNAHIQFPTVASYPVSVCINSSYGMTCIYNTTDYSGCGEDNTCLFSYASSEESNATNAHVGSCGYYGNSMCLSLAVAPSTDQVVLNSTYGTNYTDEDLTCYALVTDPDNATVDVYWQWWNGTSLEFSGKNTGVTTGILKPITYLVSGNTSKGEIWNCSVKASDRMMNDTWKNRSLEINNKPPTQPSLISPTGVIYERFPVFNWTDSEDADNDDISYILNITCYDDANGYTIIPSDSRTIYGITDSNYTLQSKLRYFGDDQYHYNWTVTANDGTDNSSVSDEWNFTLMAVVGLRLNPDEIDFLLLNIFLSNDTIDDDPDPFVLVNDGNCMSDVNITGENMLWETVPEASEYFQYKADNVTGEETRLNVNWSGSVSGWDNVSKSNVKLLDYFNWSNATDSVEVDILVKVPPGEPAGEKDSWMSFTGSYTREI